MASSGAGAPADTPAGARQCICSPTTHPGSFRCRLHRSVGVPRSASCQQFGAPRSRSLCSSNHHILRAASQLQLAHPTSVGGRASSKTSSEHQFLRHVGVSRSASRQDFHTDE
ncbi:hypothetical protein HU200_031698 [Digitaria exilis]|uniref:Uncharacterized protein n=1 Tax=Digitaria exilis TaxID=1010633 RepID=A0A835BVE8_9POAL|nr:hypothetical protein HU200_031698 [Digitaria exilis]